MDEFDPTLFRHPVWGDPIGVTKRGEPFWLSRGGSEDNNDDGAQGGSGGGGTTAQGGGTASTTDDAEDDDAQSSETSNSNTVSREDFEKIQNQLRAADKRRQELEDAAKAAEDAKKDELTKATERAQQLESRVSDLEGEIQTLRLERAMLTDPEFGADRWQDPEEVLDKLGRAVKEERVTVKDGEVDTASVKAFLKDLAAKKAYLLKTTTGGGTAGGRSGSHVGGGDRRGRSGEMSDEELRTKYRIR